MARKPHVGDSADHKSRTLDPRPVADVSEDGKWIRLQIHTLVTDWLPAKNYTYKEPRS